MNVPSVRLTIILAACAVLFCGIASGKSIWIDKNIYSSGESLQVGDIISVQVDDISQLRFTMALADSNSFNLSSKPDAGITGFLPKVNSERKINNTDKTEVSGRGNLKIVIGSRVTARRDDGKYQIAGVRSYSFNGAANQFAVSGIIDPASVKGRIVHSRDIADFRLDIRGVKEVPGVNITRPAPGPDASATSALTEEEKQRIIVDYLNKMLREMGR
ncbi:MAG: flagellar basal body L-ring protein FlgH [Spirochaetes bacterium]|jgi:flagellar basal body L-ring protein FlgH|nr:flagellar basal body L-ring protein FlgH [Spirochaetota bacterium]